MTTQPLLPAAPADTLVAFHQGRAISRAEFLGEVMALAARLPARSHFLNLCADRYHFAIGLLASMVRGAVSMLPNAIAHETLAMLQTQAPDLVCLCDQAIDLPATLPRFPVHAQGAAVVPCYETPEIDVSQLVACVFTSGSTGTPQAHHKYWGSLLINLQAEAQRLWEHAGGPCAVIGTVPFQHMYGLESTVLLPLLGGGVLYAQRPFFPRDIVDALAALPRKRVLVTTPFHLRTLLEAESAVPPADLVVSATAPLAVELARRAEAAFAAPLVEIYGATETGNIATRQSTASSQWTCFDGVRLRQVADQTLASGGHIEGEHALNDIVELTDSEHFSLLGRSSDMINVAGKRSSLAYLNHVLTSLPEVRDGCFCLPAGEQSEHTRLAAFVVAPESDAKRITNGLRQYIDPVFLPRPLVFIDAITRNATGKITQETLTQLIHQHILRHD